MARRRRRRSHERVAEPNKRVRIVYPVHLRVRVVKAVLESGHSQRAVARAFGLAETTVKEWVLRYRADGMDGLVPKPAGARPRGRTLEGDPRRDAILSAKQAEPQAGTR